jgi:hypothetical protein
LVAELFHLDRETDRWISMVKPIVTFCNCANLYKNGAGSTEIRNHAYYESIIILVIPKIAFKYNPKNAERCGMSKKEMGIVKFEQAKVLTIGEK